MPATAWIASASLLLAALNFALGYAELSLQTRLSKRLERLKKVDTKLHPALQRRLNDQIRLTTVDYVEASSREKLADRKLIALLVFLLLLSPIVIVSNILGPTDHQSQIVGIAFGSIYFALGAVLTPTIWLSIRSYRRTDRLRFLGEQLEFECRALEDELEPGGTDNHRPERQEEVAHLEELVRDVAAKLKGRRLP